MSTKPKTAKSTRLPPPHARIGADSAAERFLIELFDSLWDWYRDRVTQVQTYERVVSEAGGSFVNDHIAFRTFAYESPTIGIFSIGRLFESLGYVPAGCYHFADKHLRSLHYQHPNPHLPKLFISELLSWEFEPEIQRVIKRVVSSHRPAIPLPALSSFKNLEKSTSAELKKLSSLAFRTFTSLPWEVPKKSDVLALDEASQFGAWVAVHGYAVNHFTSLINSHGVASLSDIERTADALRKAGVGMKKEIEGAPGSKLRQTATEAVMTSVRVMNGKSIAKIPWTYAYFELAERGTVTDQATGKPVRFEGFLGPQATQLFEMTKRR